MPEPRPKNKPCKPRIEAHRMSLVLIRKSAAHERAFTFTAAWVCALASSFLCAREARASGDDAVIVLIGMEIGLADVGFWAYDVALTAKGDRPSQGAAITQVALLGPQALILAGVIAEQESRNSSMNRAEELVPAYIGTSLVGSMAVYGTLALRFKDMSPPRLFLMSQLFATNSLFTVGGLSRLMAGHKTMLPLSITELSMTTPALVFSIYRSAADEEWRPMWIGLSAWTGVLALHGLAATVARAFERDSPPSDYASVSVDRPNPRHASSRPRWPFQLNHIGPTVFSDGVKSMPGVDFSGTF